MDTEDSAGVNLFVIAQYAIKYKMMLICVQQSVKHAFLLFLSNSTVELRQILVQCICNCSSPKLKVQIDITSAVACF